MKDYKNFSKEELLEAKKVVSSEIEKTIVKMIYSEHLKELYEELTLIEKEEKCRK